MRGHKDPIWKCPVCTGFWGLCLSALTVGGTLLYAVVVAVK